MAYDNWWQKGIHGDQEMEDSHKEAWENVISLLNPNDVENKQILDFGCNQGGFLRVLYDQLPYQSAYGIDLAKKAIAVANERVGDYPITYRATGDALALEQSFDTVISTSVLYLIEDLAAHFQMIAQVLKEEGTYYASFADQSQNPSFDYMEAQINQYGATKMQNKTLTEVVNQLLAQDFSVELIKEYTDSIYDVTNYQEFYRSVDDYILSLDSSYLIKAKKRRKGK